MKNLSFTFAALILTSALAFTGYQDVSKTIQQTNAQLESSESDVYLAENDPGTSEAIPDSEAQITSASYIDLLTASAADMPSVSTAPQGNCPDCDGTGHHSNTVCGTCNGTGFYNCINEPAEPTEPQGNCPDCDGTGHHSNTVCGTCNGTGFYNCLNEPSEPTEPRGNCPDCDGTGHHSDTVCGTCNGSGWYTVQSHHGGGHHKKHSHH